MTVTLGCVFRAVLTVARTGFIWLFDVALFYSSLGQHRLGEPFDPMASTIQMMGFALGILGTLVYAYGSSRCVYLMDYALGVTAPSALHLLLCLRVLYYTGFCSVSAVSLSPDHS